MADHAKEAPNSPSLWAFINPPASVRKRFYEVLLAAQPIVVAYGLIDNATAALWIGFVSVVLFGAVARANVTDPKN